MEGTIGEIRLFGGNFSPRTWAFCDGRTLSISQYTALYSLIGTTYGGDGVSTFLVPDFRSRVAVGTGQGAGLANVVLGQISGHESTTMTTNQMPQHTHIATGTTTIAAYSGTGTADADGSVLASYNQAYSTQAADSQTQGTVANVPVQIAGGSQPFSLIQPITALNFIICLEGIFPARN